MSRYQTERLGRGESVSSRRQTVRVGLGKLREPTLQARDGAPRDVLDSPARRTRGSQQPVSPLPSAVRSRLHPSDHVEHLTLPFEGVHQVGRASRERGDPSHKKVRYPLRRAEVAGSLRVA